MSAVSESPGADRTLEDLLERVKGLSGDDRETDGLIYGALIIHAEPAGTFLLNFGYENFQFAGASPGRAVYVDGERVPAYTASLDAVVALCERVLPDHSWFVGNRDYVVGVYQGDGYGATIYHPVSSGGEPRWHGHGLTPALALLAALLEALAKSRSPSLVG